MLINLKRLLISHNLLTSIGCLLDLVSLEHLDVSFNLLEDVNPSFLPHSLRTLVLTGNPLTKEDVLKKQISERLPSLEYIDSTFLKEKAYKRLDESSIETYESRLDSLFAKCRVPTVLKNAEPIDKRNSQVKNNATMNLIKEGFDWEPSRAPTQQATESANKLRTDYLVEHNLAKLTFDANLQAFKNRYELRKQPPS
jgi:hypothetical protein